MTDSTFNLFGPIQKNDIKVGYVSTDRGYQEGLGVCEANEYAQKNPGTVFIFKPNRETVQFLSINEVNKLSKNPAQATGDEACPEGLNMNAIPEETKVIFMGGGGVGAVANPVIGDDGAVLAVDLVNGGFGYKYAPVVEIQDDTGIGAGAVVKVEVGEVEDQWIYYTDKEDFEEYEICDPNLPDDEFGRRWGPDGKDIGKWNPESYVADGTVPFADVVDEYIKKVKEAGKDWWTTRKFPPLAVTSTGQSNKTFYKVDHPTWGKFMNEYAISPVPPSNVKPSDHSGQWYTFEWNIDFPYDGEYIFRTARDDKSRIYIDNLPYTDKLVTNTGTNPISGKRGKTTGHGNKITLKKGTKVLRLDLWNEPQKEKVLVQQDSPPSKTINVGAGGCEVTFKIVGSSWFTDGVRIEGLDINEIKEFTFSDVEGQLKVTRTRAVEFGRKYKVVFTSKESSNIQLRTKDPNVIQMENAGDGSYDDVVIQASSGQFTDLKGNIAYFSVPHPPKKTGKSTKSKGVQTREVFNTVDYIAKANRQLWRTNVYNRGGFLNDYGICPFDTKLQLKDNPYAGDHTIVWPNVNFPIDGNYQIEIEVDDNVDLTIGNQVNLTKKGFMEGTSVSTGKLKTTRFIKGGNHNITAKLNQLAGGSFGFKAQDGKQKAKVKFNSQISSWYGNRLTIPGLFSISKDFDDRSVSTMNREIEVEVGKEYEVIISTIRSQGATPSTDVRKGAIRFRKTTDKSGGLGESGPRMEYEDLLKTSINASTSHDDVVVSSSQGRFYGASGNRCKFMVGESMKGINPMALAINIETEFSEKEIKSKKSWNENPMGVALSIESPLPPIPQQPIPQAEGRCPNNPFWTTRFPGGKERWYPVRFNGWGSLLNELAMSPLPPDDEGDARNDSGSFTNTWTKEFPYGGYYKVMMEVDDIGQFWIDDEKVLDLSRRKGITKDEKLIYIEGPDSIDDDPVSHDIKVVVENYKSQNTKLIDAKVFSTLDWLSGGTAKAEKKKINFRIVSASLFGDGIKIPELGIDVSKKYDGPNFNQNFVRDVEVNKVYHVELHSTQSIFGVQLRTKGESVLQMEDHGDNSWDDVQCAASEGRFFDFKPGATRATCKYVVTASTRVSGGVSGSTTRQGVTYVGPHLFHFTHKYWGKVINNEGVSPIGSPTQSLSEPNSNILGKKILTWKNVNFPQTGEYDVTFVADDIGELYIGDSSIPKLKVTQNHPTNEYATKPIKLTKGKHDISVHLTNLYTNDLFETNPTGVALKITTKQRIGTGDYKPWTVNPMGVAAKLIPPPCPKKIKGKGKVIDPIVTDPGNGYKKDDGGGYPVLLKVKDVIPKGNPINYDCSKDKIRLEPSMGSELELVCGPFGTIPKIKVVKPGLGFTRMPAVIVDSDTGVNLEDCAIVFEPEIAPFDVPDVIQVTDLVGLKQTGYYKGKPYYGAVFYENGVKYSGWYKTAGEMVQVYDTLQESIDGMVTTPPSAILRQGSDTSSNDPRLNIPRTPENLI